MNGRMVTKMLFKVINNKKSSKQNILEIVFKILKKNKIKVKKKKL